jgi:hypothetical protein
MLARGIGSLTDGELKQGLVCLPSFHRPKWARWSGCLPPMPFMTSRLAGSHCSNSDASMRFQARCLNRSRLTLSGEHQKETRDEAGTRTLRSDLLVFVPASQTCVLPSQRQLIAPPQQRITLLSRSNQEAPGNGSHKLIIHSLARYHCSFVATPGWISGYPGSNCQRASTLHSRGRRRCTRSMKAQ